MSFFSGLFGGQSLFGRDCDEVEDDPKADPIEREVCITMRQFEESFSKFPGFGVPIDTEEPESHDRSHDTPQSRREAILSRPRARPPMHDLEEDRRRRRNVHRPREDQDLDSLVGEDPSLLDQYLRKEESAPPPSHRSPSVHSHSSSVTISTIRRPDGSVEQTKTVRDSEGREEVTVTRSYGDGSSSEELSDGRSIKDKLSDWLWSK